MIPGLFFSPCVSVYRSPLLQFFREIRIAALSDVGGRSYLKAEYAHSLIEDLERVFAMAETVRSDVDLILRKIDTLADYAASEHPAPLVRAHIRRM